MKISPVPLSVLGLAATLLVHPAAQQTKIRLSTMTPGTEQVEIVGNGDFQQVGTPVGNSFPNPSGWNRFGEMYVASGSNMVAADQGIVAQGWVSATNSLSSGNWYRLADVESQPYYRDIELTDQIRDGGSQSFYRLVTPEVP